MQCVVFNCGENLDFKFMAKFFAGLAQVGGRACLPASRAGGMLWLS